MCQTRKEIEAKAPKRPYKNFAQFCLRYLRPERVALGKCPCLVCYGRGWNYHPDSQCDPVEGNKHRETQKCEACKGTGEIDKKTCFAKYREILNRWQTEIVRFKALARRRRIALSKLTKADIKALKELGV